MGQPLAGLLEHHLPADPAGQHHADPDPLIESFKSSICPMF
jgi:hypothetical protein